MTCRTSSPLAAFVALLAVVGLLVGCGRAGAPERPKVQAADGTDTKQEAPVENRPFVLDGLLN